MGGSALVRVLECRGSSRGAPRACSARIATFPCVTLSSSGAQAGAMPKDGELVGAAYIGQLEEVQRLLEDRANIDEKDWVRDGAGTSIAAGFWCGMLFWTRSRGVKL